MRLKSNKAGAASSRQLLKYGGEELTKFMVTSFENMSDDWNYIDSDHISQS